MTYTAKRQTTRDIVEFAINNPGNHRFSRDYDTVANLCAAANLKLVLLCSDGTFRAIPENANRYLA